MRFWCSHLKEISVISYAYCTIGWVGKNVCKNYVENVRIMHVCVKVNKLVINENNSNVGLVIFDGLGDKWCYKY